MKGQIADMMEGQGTSKGKKAGAGSRFSVEELKELFKLRLDTSSDTCDLLCKGTGDKGRPMGSHTVMCMTCYGRVAQQILSQPGDVRFSRAAPRPGGFRYDA